MGVSTNAIMAFGFDLGEREELPPSLLSLIDSEDDDALTYLVEHCSGEYPMYFLAAPGSRKTARRGFPAKVVMQEISQSTLDAMQNFCIKHEIEWQLPSWQIFSMWD